MPWKMSLYVVVLLFSTVIIVSFCFRLGRWRFSTGGRPLFWFLVAAAEWTLAAALESATAEEALKIFFTKLSYIGMLIVPFFFLVFSLEYAGQGQILTGRRLRWLWAPVVVFLPLVACNELHGLLWPRIYAALNDPYMLVFRHGPLFWLIVAYSYALVLAGLLALARVAMVSKSPYRGQTFLLLVAMVLPWLGNAVYALGASPFSGRDLAPVAFFFTGVILSLNLTRFQFLDLMPVAYDALFERMDTAVIVLDTQNRLTEMNRAARNLTGIGGSRLGRDAAEVFAANNDLQQILNSGIEIGRVISLGSEPLRYVEVNVSLLQDRGRSYGRLVVFHDVTARVLAGQEREKLVAELREALANIRALRGLLPICASCKRIRDDTGYWHEVEEYVSKHSEAEFSHGICPECRQRLYPKVTPKKKRQAKPAK